MAAGIPRRLGQQVGGRSPLAGRRSRPDRHAVSTEVEARGLPSRQRGYGGDTGLRGTGSSLSRFIHSNPSAWIESVPSSPWRRPATAIPSGDSGGRGVLERRPQPSRTGGSARRSGRRGLLPVESGRQLALQPPVRAFRTSRLHTGCPLQPRRAPSRQVTVMLGTLTLFPWAAQGVPGPRSGGVPPDAGRSVRQGRREGRGARPRPRAQAETGATTERAPGRRFAMTAAGAGASARGGSSHEPGRSCRLAQHRAL